MSHVFALSAEFPLTKTYRRTSSGIDKTPYPMVRDFTSHKLSAGSIEQLHQAVQLAASRGWCLLKGLLDQDLANEPRAGHTNSDQTTDWACLDFDGLDDTLDGALARLGLADLACVVQYSGSHGLSPGLRCHVFFKLAEPMAPRVLKLWLQSLNLRFFKDEISLNRIGTALRWPLDITTCQNDKLLYVAPPVLVDLDDPFGHIVTDAGSAKGRIVLRPGKLATLPGSMVTFDAAGIGAATQELLHELRKLAGYPKLRDSQLKSSAGVMYLAKPGQFTITGVRESRGFRYFNFNGGDSWAYYQPLDNPRFVYNFKGEPAYLLEDVAPEYAFELHKRAKQEKDTNSLYFAFHSVEHDSYYYGEADSTDNRVSVWPCSSAQKAKDYLKNKGAALPDTLPLMTLLYDPAEKLGADFALGTINTYKHSDVLPATVAPAELPAPARQLLEHAVGTGETLERFLDHISWVLQHKDKSGVAHVLHGIEGTGKGTFCEHVLKPLFGASNVMNITMAQLAQPFNAWMDDKLWIVVDEAQFSALRDQALIEANLRNWITEPYAAIRAMHRNAVLRRSRANWLFYSNKPDPVTLPPNDRRFHIGMFQPRKFRWSAEFEAALKTCLPALMAFLQARQVSLQQVRTLVQSEDRAKLLELSRNSVDDALEALIQGNFEFLLEQLPVDTRSTLEHIDLMTYRDTVSRLATDALQSPHQALSASDLRALLQWCVGNMPVNPGKFNKLLKHHRVHTTRIDFAGAIRPGIQVTWQQDQVWFARILKTQLGAAAKAVDKAIAAQGATA